MCVANVRLYEDMKALDLEMPKQLIFLFSEPI